MAYTREQRLQRYSESNEATQEAYSSPLSGELLMRAARTINLPDEQYQTFALLVGDFILGFYPLSLLETQLQTQLQLSSYQTSQLKAMLSVLFGKLQNATSISETITKSNKDDVVSTEVSSIQQPSSQLSERLSALRTMQGDAERIHGYGAYRRRNEPTTNKPQSETKPLTSPPRYVETEDGEQ